LKKILLVLAGLLLPMLSYASGDTSGAALTEKLDLTSHWVGYAAIVIFVLAYCFVIMEEKLHLRKSKPVMVAAGLIWLLIAFVYQAHGMSHMAEEAIRETFLEYAEMFFFLLVAMTYINAMVERDVFNALRDWLISKGFTYRALFWLTGTLAFFISPIADNMTTALIMCAVVLAVGGNEPKFVAPSCIAIVVGANAGGAFSPFGDITTLMVWQKGILPFFDFFALFIPACVNFLVPSAIMHFAIPAGKPKSTSVDIIKIKDGGILSVILFLLTIITAVSFHNFLHIPPVFGMMLGLGYLKLMGFYLRRKHHVAVESTETPPGEGDVNNQSFDVFDKIAKSEWDTLFFFYGVVMAVGGLGFLGYLALVSDFIYGELGATTANILVGLFSAIVDNIPVMYAVLTMNPPMDQWQWLLVTMTAGVGGSLLSIGSAAGVALMGQARGMYTFFSHLKWTWAVALGYAASIWVHYLVNSHLIGSLITH
jgi:Na+/H+ antiporter NhaD/arsenite permease-like protein